MAIAFAQNTPSIPEFLCQFFGHPLKNKFFFVFFAAVHYTVLNVDSLGRWEAG